MADDLSLLFKLRADNAQAKTALAETRAAVTQLRTSFGSDFAAMENAGKNALTSLGENLNIFVSQRIPLVGGAFVRVTENLKGFSEQSKKADQEAATFSKTIVSLSQSTGKTEKDISQFLKSFVQIENAAGRNAAAFKFLGGSTDAFTGQVTAKLLPELEKAGTQLTTVAAATEGAGAGLAAMAGPIGIAVIAVAALAAGIGLAAQKIFEITKSTADFQGKMFDLSQQTGVSVETLSTLEIVAKTTGGSIESIAQSLVLFQGKLDEAQDSTSKAGLKFAELGISTNNTEDAFRSALLVLSRIPEGFHQTNEAAELFGRRGGKQVLAILKELNGDVDGATEKFRRMGILITTDVSRAADEFNDQLALLQFQMRGAAAIIGNEAMPTIMEAVKDVSKVIQDNRVEIVGWVHDIGDATKGAYALASAIAFLGGQVSGLSSIPIPSIISVLGSVSGLSSIVAALKAAGGPTDIPAIPVDPLASPITTPGPGSTVKGDGGAAAEKAAREAHERASKAIHLSQLSLEELTRDHRLRLERERRLDLKDLAEYVKESKALAHQQWKDQLATLDQEEGLARRDIKGKEELVLKLNEIRLKRTKATNDVTHAQEEIDDKAQKERDRSALDIENQLMAIRDAQREGELEAIEAALKSQTILESEAVDRRLAILSQAYKDRASILDTELAQLSTSAERKIALDNEKIASEQKYTNELKRLTDERTDAGIKEAAAAEDRFGPKPTKGPLGDAPAPMRLIISLGERITEVFNEAGAAIARAFGASEEAGTQLAGVLQGAFDGMVQGIGSLVENYVLLGETGPAALKKLLAATLAKVAGEAAVYAIYYTAMGLANLFFNPAQAAADFTAAAMFASIAGVAAIAGRGIAGDSFKPQPAAATGGSSTSTTSAGKPAPIDIGRSNSATAPGTYDHVINLKVKGDAVIDEWTRDYNLNGRTRIVISSDGQLVR